MPLLNLVILAKLAAGIARKCNKTYLSFITFSQNYVLCGICGDGPLNIFIRIQTLLFG